MMHQTKTCTALISICVLQYFTLPCFAQDAIEVRAARVCAGMGQQGGNFQGTLRIDNLTIQGDGSGTVTFKRDGVDLGKMERGTYGQYTDCLMQVITLISPPRKTEYKTCSHPSFGQKGWEKQENLHGSTGWRGGGYNQDAWCSAFTNSVVASRQLGGSNFKIEKVASSEEGRWTGTFNRDRQYNYHCTMRLSTGPIYNSRTDPLCGPIN